MRPSTLDGVARRHRPGRRGRMLQSGGQTRLNMQVTFGAATDNGLVRENNEDRDRADSRTGLFAVIDGVGGQTAGEVASESVATAIQEFIQATDDDEDKTWPFGLDIALSHAGNRLRAAVLIANLTLAEQIAKEE